MNKFIRNSSLEKFLNDLADQQERRATASIGRHEPASMYGGLYDVEELDEGGDLVERREYRECRARSGRFILASELPESLEPAVPHDDEELEAASDQSAADDEPSESLHELRVEEIRYLVIRSGQTPVILRRRTTIQAL